MKYDKAYCVEINECITIYQARDLHFDESENFDGNNVTFRCPNKDCRNQQISNLTTFNLTSRKYKKTPHFKDKPSTRHQYGCPYNSEQINQNTQLPNSTHNELYKENNFPSEFLLTRKTYLRKNKAEDGEQENIKEQHKTISSYSQNRLEDYQKTLDNKTSVLEHIVECYLSNKDNRILLNERKLKINKLVLPYYKFFKQIQYFLDKEGLIYWGRIKQVIKYGSDYAIDYEKRVFWSGKSLPIRIYIRKQVIESYRKKGYFQEEIEELTRNCENTLCFFVGVYPDVKEINYNLNKTFFAFNVDIDNLDHIYFCSDRT